MRLVTCSLATCCLLVALAACEPGDEAPPRADRPAAADSNAVAVTALTERVAGIYTGRTVPPPDGRGAARVVTLTLRRDNTASMRIARANAATPTAAVPTAATGSWVASGDTVAVRVQSGADSTRHYDFLVRGSALESTEGSFGPGMTLRAGRLTRAEVETSVPDDVPRPPADSGDVAADTPADAS
jgi:hypothetical protein